MAMGACVHIQLSRMRGAEVLQKSQRRQGRNQEIRQAFYDSVTEGAKKVEIQSRNALRVKGIQVLMTLDD